MRRSDTRALFGLCLLLAGSALASDDAVAVKRAREHFDRGSELYRSARYDEAIREFEAAYAAKPHPSIFYNLGQCYEKLGRHPEAIAHYRRYLAEAPNAKDRDRVTVVIHNLEELAKREAVQPLHVRSAPEGAEVSLDGTKRGTTPLQLDLRAGTYALELALKGHRTTRREVTTSFERPTTVEVILEPLAPGELEPAPGLFARKRLWTWIALGAGAVATGTAAYFGVTAESNASRLRNTLQPNRAEADALERAAISNARAANVLYGVGGALGVAGVTLFFVEGRF